MEVVEIYSYYLTANGCVELGPKLPDLGLFGRSVNHMPGFNHFVILNAVYTYAPIINFFSVCLLDRHFFSFELNYDKD